ncbi:MAG: hypothetical protein ACI8X5_000351 [Planctomycetota bacterium]
MPLLVEAAETLFEPVVIRNNVEGYEKEVLERFDEPTWNNPVMRFVDSKAQDILPRKDRLWSTGAVAQRVVDVLEAAKREVPTWLSTLWDETSSEEIQTAAFAMF